MVLDGEGDGVGEGETDEVDGCIHETLRYLKLSVSEFMI